MSRYLQVLKGHEAKLDLALALFLKEHPKLLKEYVDLKKGFCFSKREYQIEKNRFFTKVTKMIPENYLQDKKYIDS